MRISDWSSDVCSSDLRDLRALHPQPPPGERGEQPEMPVLQGGRNYFGRIGAIADSANQPVRTGDRPGRLIMPGQVGLGRAREALGWGTSGSVPEEFGGCSIIIKNINTIE